MRNVDAVMQVDFAKNYDSAFHILYLSQTNCVLYEHVGNIRRDLI